MVTASGGVSRRLRFILWVILLTLSVVGWTITGLLTHRIRSMTGMPGMAMEPTPALLFLVVWVSMMVAMMFPSVAPMVTLFASVSRAKRNVNGRVISLALFLTGYLALWTLFGICAYLLSHVVPILDMAAPGLRSLSPMAAGAVLILVGLYQWSPLKGVCLRYCRSPLDFILNGWRNGHGGAFCMGFVHGTYCTGCCWGLMVVLFAVGLMNMGWMLLLAAVFFAEKIFPGGPVISRLVGLGVAVFGAITLLSPVLGRWTGMTPM